MAWEDSVKLEIIFIVIGVILVIIAILSAFYGYHCIQKKEEYQDDEEIFTPGSDKITKHHCTHKWKMEDFFFEYCVLKLNGRDIWRVRVKNSCQRVNVQLVPGCDCVEVHHWTVNYVTEKTPEKSFV